MKKVMCIVITICCLVACQPTPTKDIIVNRSNNQEKLAIEEYDMVPYSAPDHVQDSFSSGGVLVEIDADVIMPDIKSFSVTKVSKQKFSNNDFFRIINYFQPKFDLYYESPFTKSDWEEIIIEEKKRLAKKPPDDPAHDVSLIPVYEENYKIAPMEREYIPFNIETTKAGEIINDTEWIDAYFNYDQQYGPGRFCMRKNDNEFIYSRDNLFWQTEDIVLVGDGILGEPKGTKVSEPKISLEKARALAEKAIKDLNITGLTYDSSQKVRKIRVMPLEVIGSGWSLVYVIERDGLSAVDMGLSVSCDKQFLPSYAAPWSLERLDVFVDEDGIASFGLIGATKTEEIITQNVKMLPFDILLDKIVSQIKILYSNTSATAFIKITKIKFGISMLSITNETDYGQLVPTWYIYLEDHYKVDDLNPYQQIVAFTAHDGGYVEPRLTNLDLNDIVNN